MALAFTFPGQGSQFVGMGAELAQNFASAREVFNEVDAALSQSLSKLMWEGPMEELTMTANTQPALMACSMAVMRVLQIEFGINIGVAKYVAGHSLGEYSALCAAGCFSLTDSARLLRIRGQAMQTAVAIGEGAMVALLGASFEQAEAIVEQGSQIGICQIANDNAEGQIVISGQTSAIEAVANMAQDIGIKKAVLLPVSAPFHCAMMAPAADVMADALANVDMSVPKVAVVNNVKACPVENVAQIRDDLVAQVTARVRWRESVLWMARKGGITDMYEPGCGKVLSVMRRRITPDLTGGVLESVAQLQAFASKLNKDN